jgi:NADH-quinone oxidoreductase subunit I
MYGLGIIKGLGVTFKHFIQTFWEDIRWLGKRYRSEEAFAKRQGYEASGIFTVKYPEERVPVPEEFRYIPFLVYDVAEDGERKLRCTSCGICAKVCPSQCIWIERSNDPETGKPIPAPTEFFIDIDMCMNCGSCAEFCPFDAIKMDHDYEIATYERHVDHLYNLAKLSKPASYYASIRPVNYAREQAKLAAKEAARQAKAAAGQEKA